MVDSRESILEQLGYVVKDIQVWKSERGYRGEPEFSNTIITVASLNAKEILDSIDKEYRIVKEKIGIKTVYDKLYEEAKERLIIKEMLRNEQ